MTTEQSPDPAMSVLEIAKGKALLRREAFLRMAGPEFVRLAQAIVDLYPSGDWTLPLEALVDYATHPQAAFTQSQATRNLPREAFYDGSIAKGGVE